MTAGPGVDYGAAQEFWRSADPGAEWMATARFGLRPAPCGLALVEDFLNTGAQPDRFPDLLTGVPGARRWSTRAARAWLRERGIQAHAPALAGEDLSGLSDLRGAIEGLVTHRGAAVAVGDLGSVALSLSRSGELCWLPTGDGCRWWSAALCAEVLASREKGTWSRLKQCATSTCRVVFYDRTWNNRVQVHAPTCSV
jgi:predicted RNA-binding Zn ribbon-like protein